MGCTISLFLGNGFYRSIWRAFFPLNSYGDIYPCIIKEKIMKNLIEEDFQKTLKSQHSHLIREEVQNCKKDCWMICTARTTILSNRAKVIALVIINKLKGYQGREILS
jgi:hypothetical protein